MVPRTTAWRGEVRRLLTGAEEVAQASERYVHVKVASSGSEVTLTGMFAPCPERTVPELARYVSRMGCTQLRYGFYIPAAGDLSADWDD